MATAKSLPDLNAQVDSNFPNNTTRLITPTLLRGQQKDFIVSTAYSFFNGVPGAAQNVAAGYLVGKSRIIDYNTQIQYLYSSGTTTAVWTVITAGGTPGGSTTQLQWNNAGAFGGISGATTDGTTVTFTTGNLVGADLKASGSGGVSILNNTGGVVALFGPGGGTGTSLNGGTNIGAASADYWGFAGGTGTIAMTATGSSANINVNLVPKGSGVLQSNGVAVATLTGSQTLTNKTLTSPIINVGSDATGDIYYRNSGGLFTRLPAGTNGHVLTLAVGIPSWAASAGGGSLTIGTTTIASGTVGRILFEGTSNLLQQSANLFWDNTNARLSLGFGASPTARLSLAAAAASAPHFLLTPSTAAFTGTTDGMLTYQTVTGVSNLVLYKGTSATNILTTARNSDFATGSASGVLVADTSGTITKSADLTALGIFAASDTVTLAGTTTSATTLVSTSLVGSKTLPASFFGVGKTVEYTISGVLTLESTETATFTVAIGGTTLTIDVVLDHSSTITTQVFELKCRITCKAISGSNSTYIYSSILNCAIDATGGNLLYGTSGDSGSLAINTAATIATDITGLFSASNAANSIVVNNCVANYLN
jgi:hypothetical protein